MKAQGVQTKTILRECLWKDKKALLQCVVELEQVFDYDRKQNPPKWDAVECDETYIGKRKSNKGHKVRNVHFWFLTATGIDAAGRTVGTYWEAHLHRTKEVCEEFVRKVINGPRSKVFTDGWASYEGIQANVGCYHYVVNHSEEFVNRDVPGFPIHINHAECAHGCVKRSVKHSDHQWGRTLERCEERASFHTALFKVPDEERFMKVMQVLRRHCNNPRAMYHTQDEEEGEEDHSDHSEEELDEEEPIVHSTPLSRAKTEHIRMKRRYGRDEETGMYKYMVQGQTLKYYTIHVGYEGASCTCPQGKQDGGQRRCKHLLWLLQRESGCGWDDPLLRKVRFDDTDLQNFA